MLLPSGERPFLSVLLPSVYAAHIDNYFLCMLQAAPSGYSMMFKRLHSCRSASIAGRHRSKGSVLDALDSQVRRRRKKLDDSLVWNTGKLLAN
jgi:hypothetical protein